MNKDKLIAKPLFKFDKERKITVKENEGKIYLMLTPKRYLGVGDNLEKAINNANLNTFSTGYRIEQI